MKKTILAALAFLFAAGIAMPHTAEARVFFHARFGCCGGYYGYPYPAYYYPYYVAPPPVVYAVPPAAPTVYEAPPPVVMAQPAPVAAPVSAPSGSATFIDSAGRTCRHYEGPAPGSLNTACLQPDGTWHTVK